MCDLCRLHSATREHFKMKSDPFVIHRYVVQEKDDPYGEVGQVGYKVMLPRYDIPSDNPSMITVDTLCVRVADSYDEASELVEEWSEELARKFYEQQGLTTKEEK